MWGEIATTFGVLGGLGLAVDILILRRNQKQRIHAAIGRVWLRLHHIQLPDFPQVFARQVTKFVRPFVSGWVDLEQTSRGRRVRFRRPRISWLSLAVGACASATLTLTALALAYYFDHPGTSWSVAVVWSFRAGIWWPLILTNLPFDLATIAVTTGVLTAIARPRTGGLVIKTTFNLTVLLFDFVIALVLAIAVSPTALWILNKFSVFGFKGWIQELEDVIAGLLWLLGFQASEGLLINFLYSSTTLLPTLLVVAILAFATLAKLIADTGVGASAYLLGASTEYDREPESLPAATMLGALLAVVLSVWVAIDHMLFNSGVG